MCPMMDTTAITTKEARARAKARSRSDNPILRDAWERNGVLVCGQCSKALQAPGLIGVVSATYPQDILDRVTCNASCVAALAK